MARPRIIIADTDVNYILSLQLKFVEEFFEKLIWKLLLIGTILKICLKAHKEQKC